MLVVDESQTDYETTIEKLFLIIISWLQQAAGGGNLYG